jgi:hypothetical protein
MRSCAHPLHLTENDRRLLRAIRVAAWPCPGCAPMSAACTHPEAFVEFKIHRNELVCKCGARRDAFVGSEWYRPADAIDHRGTTPPSDAFEPDGA